MTVAKWAGAGVLAFGAGVGVLAFGLVVAALVTVAIDARRGLLSGSGELDGGDRLWA